MTDEGKKKAQDMVDAGVELTDNAARILEELAIDNRPEMPHILVVGAGKMGEAIVSGLIASDEKPANEITAKDIAVANPGEARRHYMVDTYGISAYESAAEFSDAAREAGRLVPDIVILAVKPQVMAGVLKEIEGKAVYQGGDIGPLFISIAAGISTAALEAGLPEEAHVVRVMPNTPLMVGAGASGVCGGAHVGPDEVEYVRSLFACLGDAVTVDESDLDAVTAVSGSGPAYVAAMIEALRDAAADRGLDAELAERLATQTVYGTAKLMLERGQSAEKTRVDVCSPGGTTLAALDAMYAAGFNGVFAAGVDACIKRSKELGA